MVRVFQSLCTDLRHIFRKYWSEQYGHERYVSGACVTRDTPFLATQDGNAMYTTATTFDSRT